LELFNKKELNQLDFLQDKVNDNSLNIKNKNLLPINLIER